jgi:hypothetical protein
MTAAQFINILVPVTLIEMMVAIGLAFVLPSWQP